LNKASTTRLVVVKVTRGKAFEIDAISGATISSRSVTGIVNKTIMDIKAQLVSPPKEAIKNETGKIKENT
jgi:electron transport complex protein RnfG